MDLIEHYGICDDLGGHVICWWTCHPKSSPILDTSHLTLSNVDSGFLKFFIIALWWGPQKNLTLGFYFQVFLHLQSDVKPAWLRTASEIN